MANPQIKEDDDFNLPKDAEKAKKDEGPAIEIEIVDDTPPEDRGKEPFPEDAGEDDGSDPEQYSKNVKKRIDRLTAERHDERRKKEAAERQLNEASQIVISYQNELARMNVEKQHGQVRAYKETKDRIERDLKSARAAYKAAVDSGDADQMADAQEALATASAERTHIERVMPPEEPQPQQPQPIQYQQPVQQQAQAPIDPKTTKWVQNNPWFEADGEEDKTFLAYGLHYKMVGEGFDPTTDEYYSELDARLASVYPNIADGGAGVSKRRKPPQTVVASAHREPGSPTKVRLTSSEVSLAKKFGVTVEDFAKEKLRLAKQEQGL